MNRRDYFAAHAPADAPAWFKFEPSSPSPKPRVDALAVLDTMPEFTRLRSDDQERVRNWCRDPDYDMDEPRLQAIGQGAFNIANRHNDGIQLAHEARAKERYFAWRVAYADGLIDQLNQQVTA